MTNYISFSLYGTKCLYSCGAVENARIASSIYPNWKVVVYVGKSVNKSTIDLLKALGAVTILQPEEETPSAMFWRFQAVNIPDAERVIFRDADSRISAREASAVTEWISSGKSLHIIRDHPWHSKNIMGGMWGVQGSRALEIVSDHLQQNTYSSGKYGDDQDFISSEIYPDFLGDRLAHDSFYRFTENTRSLGPRKSGEFIGEVIQCDGEFDSDLRGTVARYESSKLLKNVLRITRLAAKLKATSRSE